MLLSFRNNYLYWTLIACIGLIFLIGGGSRDDIQSLALLRPLMAIFLGIGLLGLTFERVARFRFPIVFLGLCILAVAAQLIPLPPSLWTLLPGREPVVQMAQLAGVPQPWRPISLVPYRTANALFALLVPLAVLVLAIQCSREQRYQLLPVFIGVGLISGFLGLLQAIGPAYGPLYLYNITNNGLAVGLFANRNHQAVFLVCLFPMLAVYASTGARTVEAAQRHLWLSVGAGVFIVPLLLVTGSRAGIVLGVVGLVAAYMLYRRPRPNVARRRSAKSVDLRLVIGLPVLVVLVLITLLASRAIAIERLLVVGNAADRRLAFWGLTMDMIERYFPFGSGYGTFIEAYQLDEPFNSLSTTYINRAHNDWLEVIMNGGVIATILLAVAVGAWGWKIRSLIKRRREGGTDMAFNRLGAILILLLALASLVDYPLRVPSIACFFTIAAVWMTLDGPLSRSEAHSDNGAS